jgi:hypothetical protein
MRNESNKKSHITHFSSFFLVASHQHTHKLTRTHTHFIQPSSFSLFISAVMEKERNWVVQKKSKIKFTLGLEDLEIFMKIKRKF